MAAEIHSRPQSSRPVLLSKIEGHQDAVTAALLIPKEDGVITASEDRLGPRGVPGAEARRGWPGLPPATGAPSLSVRGRPPDPRRSPLCAEPPGSQQRVLQSPPPPRLSDL